MKTKSKVTLIVAVIIVAAICLIKTNVTSNNVFEMNVDALASEGQEYFNAKLAYCNDDTGHVGCKGALMRKCTGIFCN